MIPRSSKGLAQELALSMTTLDNDTMVSAVRRSELFATTVSRSMFYVFGSEIVYVQVIIAF